MFFFVAHTKSLKIFRRKKKFHIRCVIFTGLKWSPQTTCFFPRPRRADLAARLAASCCCVDAIRRLSVLSLSLDESRSSRV